MMSPAEQRDFDRLRDAVSRSGPPSDPARLAAFDALARIEERTRLLVERIRRLEGEARASLRA